MKQRIYILFIFILTLGGTAVAQTDTSVLEENILIDRKGVKVTIKEKTSEIKTDVEGDSVRTKIETIEITTSREEGVSTDTDGETDGDEFDIKRIIKEELTHEVEKIEEPKFIETNWNNFHLGFNNLINSDGELDVATEGDFGSLDIASTSVNFTWDIISQAMNIYKGKVRLIYGIGLDYNNYRFKNNITLVKNTDRELEVTEDAVRYDKNKLVVQHVNVPLLINFKIAPRHKDDYLYISGGANFGYRIGSHIKQKWNDNGKKKHKIEDDFNLEQFRVGYELQFGYKNVVVYGKYFPQSIFKANGGPELRAVSAGILIGKI